MKFNVKDFLRKYTMVIALVIVFILFCGLTNGRLLYAQNMSNLMLQNGYVLVLACGMLLCILTGGNIDLSVGAVICLVGGLAAVTDQQQRHEPISDNPHLSGSWSSGRYMAGLLDRLQTYSSIYHNTCRYVHLPWIRTSDPG